MLLNARRSNRDFLHLGAATRTLLFCAALFSATASANKQTTSQRGAQRISPRQLFFPDPPASSQTQTEKREPKSLEPSPNATAASALAVRFRIFRLALNGREEVPSGDVRFTAGDRIQIQIEANQSCILTVAYRGSTGRESVLLKSRAIGGKTAVFVPAKEAWLKFDKHVGVETVYIVADPSGYPRRAAPTPMRTRVSEILSDATPGGSRDLVIERPMHSLTGRDHNTYVTARRAGRLVVPIKLIHR